MVSSLQCHAQGELPANEWDTIHTKGASVLVCRAPELPAATRPRPRATPLEAGSALKHLYGEPLRGMSLMRMETE